MSRRTVDPLVAGGSENLLTLLHSKPSALLESPDKARHARIEVPSSAFISHHTATSLYDVHSGTKVFMKCPTAKHLQRVVETDKLHGSGDRYDFSTVVSSHLDKTIRWAAIYQYGFPELYCSLDFQHIFCTDLWWWLLYPNKFGKDPHSGVLLYAIFETTRNKNGFRDITDKWLSCTRPSWYQAEGNWQNTFQWGTWLGTC